MNSLIATETRIILIDKLHIRTNYWGRLKGLLFYNKLEKGSAMLLFGSKRVHTFGMAFSIDLYFFCGSMRLIDFSHNVKPWKAPKSPSGTMHIIETQHYEGAKSLQLNMGEQVSIIWKL